MSIKMYENLLVKLNNAAKARKESMAIENGFKTAAEFKDFLKTKINENFVLDKGVDESKGKAKRTKKVKEELTDLVIAFDTTSSMNSYISSVKNHVKDLIPASFKANKNLKISIVAFGDYCDMRSPKEFDKAYQVVGLTNDENSLINFVKNAHGTGGGDYEEFYELVIKKITEETEWRVGASKSVLLIGDATPHKVGYSYHDKVQNNQIDWKQECAKAADKGIKIDTLSITGQNFYEEVAKITGGICIPFTNAAKTSQLVESTVLARGGENTRSAFLSKSVSSEVTADADMSVVYSMYKTIIKK